MLGKPKDYSETLRIDIRKDRVAKPRNLVARKIGPTLEHSVPFIPDTNDTQSHWMGVIKRMGAAMPKINFKRQFREHARALFKRDFEPLDPDTDLSQLSWLDESHYTEKQKCELIENSEDPLSDDDYEVKQHDKMETLADEPDAEAVKFIRIINSRTDRFKMWLGPLSHAMEQMTMRRGNARKYFAKYVPKENVLTFIRERFRNKINAGYKIGVTDYTSFESHMVPELMKIIEMQYYRHMISRLDKRTQQRIMNVLFKALAGRQKCKSKFGTMHIDGTRMSGEMTTSLGNGITNLVLTTFVYKIHNIDVDIIVEGDDGIFVVPKNARELTEQDFLEVGAKVKIKYVNTIEEADFCGNFGAEAGDNTADIFEVFNRTGWSTSQQKDGKKSTIQGLLRAKGFSLAYSYPNCPIVRSYAEYLLRITEGSKAILGDTKHKMTYKESLLLDGRALPSTHGCEALPKACIAESTRRLIARTQHISIEVQREYERLFDTATTEMEFIPNLCFNLPPLRMFHASFFVRFVPPGCSNELVRTW